MSRMLNRNYKLTGRCHPWCGDLEYIVGRAAEKRAVAREIADQTALPGDLSDPICPVSLDICDDCMDC